MFNNLAFLSKANKIRTKLLLFIDKEIQTKIKQKKLFYNPQHEDQRNAVLYSNRNKMYSHQENRPFISSLFEEKNLKNEAGLKKIKHNFQLPITNRSLHPIFQIKVCYRSKVGKKKLHKHCFSFNNTINVKDSSYSIKKVQKPSSTFQIYKKPKTDKKYLKNLCNSLKIIKKNNLLLNKRIKYKLSSIVNHRVDSSPTKKTKKKESCRLKSNINNLRF